MLHRFERQRHDDPMGKIADDIKDLREWISRLEDQHDALRCVRYDDEFDAGCFPCGDRLKSKKKSIQTSLDTWC
jgi:hypothetical protein